MLRAVGLWVFFSSLPADLLTCWNGGRITVFPCSSICDFRAAQLIVKLKHTEEPVAR